MDLHNRIVNPHSLDDVRLAFEDQFAIDWIDSELSRWAFLQATAAKSGLYLVPVIGPSGLKGVAVIDQKQLSDLGIRTPFDGKCDGKLLFQSAFLTQPRFIFASNVVDLLLATYSSIMCDDGDSLYYTEQDLSRTFGSSFVRDLRNTNSLTVCGVGRSSKQSVQLPLTFDKTRPHIQKRIQIYAQSYNMCVDEVDPISNDYVWGLERWHACNQPFEWRYLSEHTRSQILVWITKTFESAASSKPCPASCYGLKHWFEWGDDFSVNEWDGLGFAYVSNGAFKGGMIAAGYMPEDIYDTNTFYSIKLRKGLREQIRASGKWAI